MLSLTTPIHALEPTAEERAARQAIAERIPRARLLWVRDGRIFHTRLGDWEPRAIGSGDEIEDRPRWSPDGRYIVFQRGSHVYLMEADFTGARRVIPDADTADWTGDGDAITAIAADGHRVLRFRLATGRVDVLYDSRLPPRAGETLAQAAELRAGGRYLLTFRRDPSHASLIIDLEGRRVIANEQMKRGDCKPAWADGGRWVLATARTADRPVVAARFDADTGRIEPSRYLVGLEAGLRYYAHDARASNDARWVVFGGKVILGAGMLGGREIYIWPLGDADRPAVRLTFDAAEDGKPSLFVPGG